MSECCALCGRVLPVDGCRDPACPGDRVRARVSTGVPAGTVVFTLGAVVIGMRVGEQATGKPERADTAHFSAADFPRGLPDLVEAFKP